MQTHRRPRKSRRRCFGCRALVGITGNPLTVLCGTCRQRVLDAKAGAATATRAAERKRLDRRHVAELQVECTTCAGTGTFDGFAPCNDCAGRGSTPATAAGGPPAAPAREVLPGTGAPPAALPAAAGVEGQELATGAARRSHSTRRAGLVTTGERTSPSMT